MVQRDPQLTRIIFKTKDSLGILHWVELGAHIGNTLETVGGHFQKSWACETYPPRQAELRDRFAGKTNVTLYDESCLTALPRILQAVGSDTIFAFDDAHWEDQWPLVDNLRLLHARGNAVVLIHDAFVPGYPNFVGCTDGCGSADASNGGRTVPMRDIPLNETLIRSVVGDRPLLWPSYPGDWLGWCIVNLTDRKFPEFPQTFWT